MRMENRGKESCTCIVPCYNEEETIPQYYAAMQKIREQMAEKLEFLLLFVDDGSSDRTLDEIKALAQRDEAVHYLSFSRNFGKEAALYAGLEHADSDYVVIMDVDLQDPPDLIPQMYEAVKEEGYDCVGCRRVTRKGEPPIRSFFARKFYSLMRHISDTDIVDGARDYRFMTRKVADAIVSMEESNRFSKGIYGWVGFRTKGLAYENRERVAGKTKWSFFKLFRYSIEGIAAFSTKPLTIASFVGCLFCFVAMAAMLFIFGRAALYGDPVAGWPSMVCVITFLGGVQLFCLGIIGMYLSRTYLEVKKRPIYLVREEK